MATLTQASLSTEERSLLARFSSELAWLKQRREIRSFFIAEVDRDKIVVAGQI